jgi:quercetin dioxygenase-like cupin family protein
MAATEVYAKYEELCPWHHREPFADGVQRPIVLRPDDSYFVSWAPAPGNSTPGWITVSTPRVNAGVFLVQPGGWFDAGNHPGPEPYYILKGTLHLSNPDTGDVIEISAGDASNIPAFAYHHAHNFGDEACWIQWWVPGEMHTDDFKRKVCDGTLHETGWYERDAVVLNGPHTSNDGFLSRLDLLSSWPSDQPRDAYDIQKLDRSTWLHTLQGNDPRLRVLTSFFYADERIRCGEVRLPASRESEPEVGDYELVLYVTAGDFLVNLTDTAQTLKAQAGDTVFLPPGVRHSYQAMGDEPARAVFAMALA